MNPLHWLIIIAAYIGDVYILATYKGDSVLMYFILWAIVIGFPLLFGCIGFAILGNKHKASQTRKTTQHLVHGGKSMETAKSEQASGNPLPAQTDAEDSSSFEINNKHELMKYNGKEETVIVPDGVLKIGIWAFSENQHIKRVVLPDSVTLIRNCAFSNSSIEEIEIPDGVSGIENCAFHNCRQLRKIKLPCGLKKIEFGTFRGCSSLTEIEFPSGLKEVNSLSIEPAFAGSGIRNLVLPTGMTLVNNAFKSMYELESVYMPDTILSIGEGAFWDCGKLKKVRFSKNLRMIGTDAFNSCGSLEEIDLPEGLIEIGNRAFGKCRNLSRVKLPNDLLKLGRWAFMDTPYAETVDMEALSKAVNMKENYQKPDGYSELNFSDMAFYYKRKTEKANPEMMGSLRYDRPVMDSIDIYRNQRNEEILRIYVEVPTFDSGDREWDSYRKLYLFRHEGELWGLLVAGGYRIARIDCYEDIRCADSRTEKMLQIMMP